MGSLKRFALIAALWMALASQAPAQLDQQLDSQISKLMAGVTLTQSAKDDSNQQFVAYFNDLCTKNKVTRIGDFLPEDAATHYVYAIQMSVIDPERHGAWPIQHGGRKAAFPILKKRLAESNEPVLMAAVIIPALDNGEVKYACDMYRALSAKNEFWAHYILKVIQFGYYSPDAAKQFLAEIYQTGVSK